jgi:D-amino peptidase
MMKVFIMTDLEGPSGVNGRSDGIGNRIINEPAACELLLEEVNATVEGLVRGGATEIVVWDGHGGSNSIDIRKLHPAASLGTIGVDLHPVNLLDAGFDAAIQLGVHAVEGIEDGYLNHSYNSHAICNMWLNDVRIGEIGITTLMASYFNVPTVLVSGDVAGCREAREFIGGKVETVETKKAVSRYSCVNRNPAQVRLELIEKAEKAIRELKSFSLKKFQAPYEFKIEYMCPNIADIAEKQGAERIDHKTIIHRSDDFIDVWSQHCGWASGVHNKKYGITPENNKIY